MLWFCCLSLNLDFLFQPIHQNKINPFHHSFSNIQIHHQVRIFSFLSHLGPSQIFQWLVLQIQSPTMAPFVLVYQDMFLMLCQRVANSLKLTQLLPQILVLISMLLSCQRHFLDLILLRSLHSHRLCSWRLHLLCFSLGLCFAYFLGL